MVRYRRNRTPGGSFFFTVTLRDRRSDLLLRHVDILRASFADVQARLPFHIDAIVILPEHLHALWTLPVNDSDYPNRWRAIKTGFTRSLRKTQGVSKRSPWQSRYWEHTIRNEEDWRRHMDYIHYNPVKHGYVSSPGDWPYGSFSRAVRAGMYEADWGASEPMTIVGMDWE